MTCGMEHGHGHGLGGYGHGAYGGMKGGHHACPICGMRHAAAGYGAKEACRAGYGYGHGNVVKKAMKKLLIEKTKAKIDERWGEKLDAVAQELVDMAEEKMKMKKDIWKHKKEMRERMHEIFAEMEEEEE